MIPVWHFPIRSDGSRDAGSPPSRNTVPADPYMILRDRRDSVSCFRPGIRPLLAMAGLFLVLVPASRGSPPSAGEGRDVSIVSPSGFRTWLRGESARGHLPDSILLFSAEDQLSRLLESSLPVESISLFQVVPLERGISAAHFENWRSSLPEPARTEGAFSLDNGLIHGEGRYRRIRIGPVILPGGWPDHTALVVDAGFFIPLYKDEVRTPMVPLVLKLVATLKNASVRWETVRIINRNSDPVFPLEFGYIPDLLREVLSDPNRFRDSIPEPWAQLDRAQYMAFFGQVEEASRGYEALFRMGIPAAAWYQAATLSFRGGGDLSEGIRYLAEAAKRDKAYSRGFLVQGAAFWDRGNLPAAEQVLRKGRELFPENSLVTIGLARNLAEQAAQAREEDPVAADRMIREALSFRVPEDIRAEILKDWSADPVIPIAPVRPAEERRDPPGSRR